MAVFRYRLEVLLEQKQAALEDAQTLLAQRLKIVREEEARMETLQHEAAAAADRARHATKSRYLTDGPVPPEKLQARAEDARWLDREAGWAKDRVLAQRIAIEDAEDAAEQARRDLTEANRQVEVLRKHRERQERRFRKEQERAEELLMDDAGNAQFLKRSRE